MPQKLISQDPNPIIVLCATERIVTVQGGYLSKCDNGKPSARVGRKLMSLAPSGQIAGTPDLRCQADFFSRRAVIMGYWFWQPKTWRRGLLPIGRKKKLLGSYPFYLALAVLILTCGLNLSAWGQEEFHTRYAVVSAQSAADLLEMERRLHFATLKPASQPRPRGEFAHNPGFPRLAAKIDSIMVRVARLLNLCPSRLPRLNIVLLSNAKEVRQRHRLLIPLQSPGLYGYGSLEAFYYAATSTVYLSLIDLHEGILAHEWTHHLLCTALVLPSAHDQEAWARFVESRL